MEEILVSKGKSNKKQKKISKIYGKSKTNHQFLYYAFNELTPKELFNETPTIIHYLKVSKYLGYGQIDNHSYMYNTNLPSTDLLHNLYWCLGIISYYKNTIIEILNYERDIANLILKSKYNESLELINFVDSNYGVSTWSLSIRGCIYYLAKDEIARIKYFEELSSKCNQNKHFSSISWFLLNRFQEGSVTFSSQNSLKKQLERNIEGEDLHYLLYKLVPFDIQTDYKFEYILNREKEGSIIDIYKCIIDFLTHSYIADNKLYCETSQMLISELKHILDVEELNGLFDLYGLTTEWSFNDREILMYDLYTEGKYDEFLQLYDTDKLNYKFMFLECACNSRVYCNKLNKEVDESLFESISDSVYHVIQKENKYSDSLQFLNILTHSLQSISWFKELRYFIIKESIRLDDDLYEKIDSITIALSKCNLVTRWVILSEVSKKLFLNEYMKLYSNSTANYLTEIDKINYESHLGLPYSKVDKTRFYKCLAYRDIRSGNFNDAIIYLEKLQFEFTESNSKNEYNVVRLLVDAYLLKGKYINAISQFAKEMLKNHNYIHKFNTKMICNAATTLINDNSSILVPIAISYHARFIDSNYDSNLTYSFERFLFNNRINNPFDIVKHNDLFTNEELFYFLQNVCTPEVMKLYDYFDSTKSIEECRIEICKYLVENNYLKEKNIEEIKDRTKKLVLRNALKQVENSRIFSDATAITNDESNKFKGLFDQFLKLRKNDFSNSEDEQYFEKLYDVVGDVTGAKHAHTLYILEINMNEKNMLFYKLIKLIRDEFVFGEKGINNSISYRIRHGHLPTTIRKCVNEEKLITSKISGSKNYKNNEYWLNKWIELDEEKKKSINNILAEFSNEFDRIVYQLNNEWVQISTFDQEFASISRESKPNAVFKYALTYYEAYSLQRLIEDTSDYYEFTKHIINWLWSRTDDNLQKMRDKIDEDLRMQVINSFEIVQSRLREVINNKELMMDFNSSIARAKTQLNYNLELVKTWFTPSEKNLIDKFEIDIPVRIAESSLGIVVNYSHHLFLQFNGEKLSYFVDILYIIFENAISKSNLAKDDLKISLDIFKNNDETIIKCINNCSELFNLEDANDKLNYYRLNFDKDDILLSSSQDEGGTGLFKICKLLNRDLCLDYNLKVSYLNLSEFQIILELKNIEVCLYEENIDSRR